MRHPDRELVVFQMRVIVCSGGVRARPIGWVDGVGRDVRAVVLAAVRVLADFYAGIGQGRGPVAEGRELATGFMSGGDEDRQ